MSELPGIPAHLVTVVPASSGAHRRNVLRRKPRRWWTAAVAVCALTGAGVHTLLSGPGNKADGRRTEPALSQPDLMTAADADTGGDRGPAGSAREQSEGRVQPTGGAAGSAEQAGGTASSASSPSRNGRSAPVAVVRPAGDAPPSAPVQDPEPPAPPAPPSPSPSLPEPPAPVAPPAPPAPAVPPEVPADHVTLAKGDIGPQVRELHTNLWALSLLSIEPSEEYCDTTAAAVRTFQEQEGVSGDAPGVYGPHTHRALTTKVAALPEKPGEPTAPADPGNPPAARPVDSPAAGPDAAPAL
ncbi:peptidoglycan-binding protein [Streptomyces sp. NPDC001404]|uniref:peptidoglycan-binding domain-containing protein n=1 Tax=Streptomyces sp. NPDC001404 TaxID=3364571 RepID=UPI0036CBD882